MFQNTKLSALLKITQLMKDEWSKFGQIKQREKTRISHLVPKLCGECQEVQKTGCDSKGCRYKWLQLSHGKKVFKKLQDNQEID